MPAVSVAIFHLPGTVRADEILEFGSSFAVAAVTDVNSSSYFLEAVCANHELLKRERRWHVQSPESMMGGARFYVGTTLAGRELPHPRAGGPNDVDRNASATWGCGGWEAMASWPPIHRSSTR
jgi:hypothetical protein